MPATPITIARHRATLAKRGLVFGSVLAFAATIGLGQAQVSPSTSSQTPSVSTGAS